MLQRSNVCWQYLIVAISVTTHPVPLLRYDDGGTKAPGGPCSQYLSLILSSDKTHISVITEGGVQRWTLSRAFDRLGNRHRDSAGSEAPYQALEIHLGWLP